MNEFELNENLQNCLIKKGINNFSQVQKKVIPEILEKKDLIFQSDTGTGKTLAYLLPLIKLYSESQNKFIIIVSPTQELSSQIKTEAQSLGQKAVLFNGGSPIKRQIEQLKEKPFIIAGSCSRIYELIILKKIKLSNLCSVVFDEADRLFSKELIEQTNKLIDITSENLQIQYIACSATIKDDIITKFNNSSKRKINFETVIIPHEDVLTRQIKHIAILSEKRKKIDTLRSFLIAEKPEKTLVFTSRPEETEIIASKLQYKKINCETLHSKTDKQKRKNAIDHFKNGKISILITSDLSARGLDIPDVTHVIQMDLPSKADFFIHRSGRTARMGKTGVNVVIGDSYEMEAFARLEKKLKIIVHPAELRSGKLVFFE